MQEERRTIFNWQCVISAWSLEKGWSSDLRNVLASITGPERVSRMHAICDGRLVKLALIHSEVSEALEECRKPDLPMLYAVVNGVVEPWDDEKHAGLKPEGLGVEIADVIIRALNFSDLCGFDAEEMVARKMAYNQKRPFRHGGKLA